jgi:3-dehydroquinate synthase
MSKGFKVKSRLKYYEVRFVDDFRKALISEISDQTFIIIDNNIARIYRDKLKAVLPKGRVLVIRANEQSKSLDSCSRIIKSLISGNIRRNSVIIAIGGGVIQDVAAFISSILFRGIDWIFVPTTLLAQADSCIGGKTSINFEKYKNLIGSFNPPTKIYIDTEFLNTLPANELKSGIGEILHYYLIAGSQLANSLMIDYQRILNSATMLKSYIIGSLLIKKKVIEKDEFDKGIRNLFNYGHTFGHAIETVSDYKINHGQAVTLGMDMANYLSFRLGFLRRAKYEGMHKLLKPNIPGFHLQNSKMADYIKSLSKDKKNINRNLSWIMTNGPGAMKKVQTPLHKKFQKFIEDYFKDENK